MDDSGRGDRVKLFTLDEANSALEHVRPLLEGMAEAKRGLDATQIQLSSLTPESRQNGHRLEAIGLERRLERLVEQLATGIGELERLGIELKDIDEGIIDFPSLHNGRVIFLCWRLGEGEIAFWHEISSGFAGRRPIGDLNP